MQLFHYFIGLGVVRCHAHMLRPHETVELDEWVRRKLVTLVTVINRGPPKIETCKYGWIVPLNSVAIQLESLKLEKKSGDEMWQLFVFCLRFSTGLSVVRKETVSERDKALPITFWSAGLYSERLSNWPMTVSCLA